MDEETLEALKASISHWEKNVSAVTVGDVSLGIDNCALCQKFYCGDASDCDGCPVAEFTGVGYCIGTPYDGIQERLQYWDDGNSDGEAMFRRAAQAELDFLRWLLPDNTEDA